MDNPRLVAASAIALAVTLFALFAMRPWARRVGLVDRPNERKRHSGRVPIIGGICFFLGTLAGTAYLGYLDGFVMSVIMGGALIVAAGVADDVCDLSVRARLGGEAAIIGLVVLGSGIYIDHLGTVLPGVDLRLGLLGIPVTIIAVIGLINAFNMLDGIDGLASSMAMVSIGAILLFSSSGVPASGMMLVLVVVFASLIPYLCVNLGWPDGRKVFMGDAGSTLLGFVLGWSLISLSHPQQARLAPVDVLWCVALPVLDIFGVMVRRMRQGRSPFDADRQHLHHLMIDAGLGPRATLVAIVLAASALVGVGYGLRGVPVLLNLAVFVAFLAAYVTWLPALLGGHRRLAGRLRRGRDDAAMPVAAGLPSMEAANFDDTAHGDRQPATAIAFGARPQALSPSGQAPVKTLCVLAALPDAVGLAQITRQLIRDQRFQSSVCVADMPASQTEEMLRFFGIQADFRLDAECNDNPADVTSANLAQLMRLIGQVQPDVILVTGNQCVVLAASLAAYYSKVPLVVVNGDNNGHAGSSDANEGGHKIVQALAAMHVVANERIGQRLRCEGIPGERVLVNGDTGAGTLRTVLEQLRRDPTRGDALSARFPFLRDRSPLLLAVSMQGRDEDRRHLVTALEMVARRRPDVDIIWPVSASDGSTDAAEIALRPFANVHLMEVPDYLEWVHLLDRAYLVLTDNQSLAEGRVLGKPVIFIHDEANEDYAVDSAGRAAGIGPVATAGRVLTLLSEDAAYRAMCELQKPQDLPAEADCQEVLEALAGICQPPAPVHHKTVSAPAEDYAEQRVREAS